ncbi:MAG: alpha/beta fold hydrolase [Candidatus Eremiobacteraeota bacterium]|nr:alpha/beta fold hydrolase [Candidatus Eremiobacteraeota bacterium]
MRRLSIVLGPLGAFALLAANATTTAPNVTAPAAPPNGTYTYALSRNGADLGTTTVVVFRRDSTHAIETDEAGQAGAARAHVVGAYRYADMSPETYIATYQAPFLTTSALGRAMRDRPHGGFDAQTTVRYHLGDDGDSATIDGSPETIDAGPPAKDRKAVRRLWILDGPFMTGALLLPAYRRRSGESQLAITSLAFDDAAGSTIVAQRLVRATPQFPKTPKGDVTIEEQGVAKIWFDPGNYIVHEVHFAQLNVDARLVTYLRATAPAPFEPAPSPAPKTRVPALDVDFQSLDGTQLSGVLGVPSGIKKLPPVVVFVPPGPSARRTFGGAGPTPMFPELAAALVARGYAVLRYDTRGVAKSGGSSASQSWDQALADAKAALQFAAATDGIDSAHVYALGYGNGADLALAAAASADVVKISGVVALAPSVVSYRECAKREGSGAQSDDDTVGPNDGTWRKTSFAHDPTALATRTRVPLFVLHPGVPTCGEKSDETSAYDDKLRTANALATIVVAGDLGARFGGRYDADAPENTEAFLPYRFDASTEGAIADWLDSPKTAAAANEASGTREPASGGPSRTKPPPPPPPDESDSGGMPSARSVTARPSPAPTRSSEVRPGQVVVPGATASPTPASIPPPQPSATPT